MTTTSCLNKYKIEIKDIKKYMKLTYLKCKYFGERSCTSFKY